MCVRCDRSPGRAAETHAIGDGIAGDAAQRRQHRIHRRRDAGNVDAAGVRERCDGRFVRDDQVVDGAARRREPHPRLARDRAYGVDAIQRFAQDAAGERRCGLVRFARPHADRRQPQAAAVDEALARPVVDEEFADRLLIAVRRLRPQRLRVGHRIGQRAAEHRAGAREDEPGRCRERAAALEQRSRGIDVDAPAEVEVRFGFTAHDGGEMKDAVGASASARSISAGSAMSPVNDRTRGSAEPARRPTSTSVTRSICARLASRVGKRAARQQCGGEFAAEESGAAGDDDVHGVSIERSNANDTGARARDRGLLEFTARLRRSASSDRRRPNPSDARCLRIRSRRLTVATARIRARDVAGGARFARAFARAIATCGRAAGNDDARRPDPRPAVGRYRRQGPFHQGARSRRWTTAAPTSPCIR